MDNLTHSLIGAALGQAGLKRKTGLAMPALIIGANIPDVDAACLVWLEGIVHVGFRRGITHGPPAMVLLPLALAGALWWFDKWQAKRGTRPEGRLPVSFKWLFLLSLIACLSHPLFDWFNNYGVRLLEPFSSQWFYGDTLFIIDPWIIAMLGAGVWFSLRRERGDGWKPNVPAVFALCSVAMFVAINALLSITAVASAREVIAKSNPVVDDPLIVANAKPLAFWRREILWRGSERFGHGDYDAFGSGATFDRSPVQYVLPPPQLGMARFSDDVSRGSPPLENFNVGLSDPRIAAWSKGDPQAQAFLFWSRMPIAELHEDRIVLRDQRFLDPRVVDRFSVTLRPPQGAKAQ